MTEFETVAFDVETTGFEPDDRLTVAGFDAAVGSRIFLNTGGRPRPAALESRLDDTLSPGVRIAVSETEAAVLEAVTEFVATTLAEREVKLVAFNGDRWNGGFDLLFLRTRLATHDVDWPFVDLPYVDVMNAFETRFNTSDATLGAVYEELLGDGLGDLDPFDDGEAAVDAWTAGEFSPLVHNVANIRRTRALMALAERYCSTSDLSMKSLDPVAELD
jgi:hypothetical protein